MSGETISDSALRAEFEALARRAGIEIMEDRRDAMLKAYRDYRHMTDLLHGDRPGSVEGASVFSIESINRSETKRRSW